ncbi:MAG TPA: hypothetical protein VKA94_06340 [Hyphomicrobiales bacterium]|nr:hypothetical protein [Hyphomicrobiales bacterium]
MIETAPRQSAVDWLIAILASTMCVACILWNIETPTRLGVAILTEQYLSLQLGLALTICFLRFDWSGARKTLVGWFDAGFAAVCFLVLMYAALDFSRLLTVNAGAKSVTTVHPTKSDDP